jgi:hypothetical protein
MNRIPNFGGRNRNEFKAAKIPIIKKRMPDDILFFKSSLISQNSDHSR